MKKSVVVFDNYVTLQIENVIYFFNRGDVEFFIIGKDDRFLNTFIKNKAIEFEDCIDYDVWVDLEQLEYEAYDTLVMQLYLAFTSDKLKPTNIEQL